MNTIMNTIMNTTTYPYHTTGTEITITGDLITSSSNITIVGVTGSGMKVELKNDGINPALVFRYLKSKWTTTEIKKLKGQAKKLQKFVRDTKELGQQAAHEELVRMLLSITGILELQACGFDKYIQEDTVKKFEYKVKDRVLKFDKFENFPRAIPDDIRLRIKEIQKKGMFDEYWILYLDYAKEKLNTNKDRIKEKDPILFGKIKSNPDKLFYLVDWVDEYCDLTLAKFVEEVKTKNPDFQIEVLPELDDNYLADLKKEFEARRDRLSGATPSNFRDLMVKEEEANKKKVPKEKASFFGSLRKKFKWQK